MLLGRSFARSGAAWDFGVAQWNILADHLSDAFPMVEEKRFLSWEHRGPLIVEEMRRWLRLGLVVCMQEVDKFADLERAVRDEAVGIFAEKHTDGCAMFVPRGRYSVLDSGHERLLGEGHSHLMLHCRLEDATGRRFLLVTTHLKAKVGNEEIRDRQTKALAAKSQKVKQPDDILIVCGDFNDIPSSAAVTNMRNLNLVDAYEEMKMQSYTTSKIREKLVTRTIDYIWYPRDGPLECVDCLQIPPQESLGPRALPNGSYPSDHLGIASVFRKR